MILLYLYTLLLSIDRDCKGDWSRALQEIPQLNYSLWNILQPISRRFLRELVSQTLFGHISTDSLTILTVSTATESPWKDLSIDTSYASKRSVLAEILGRSTSNYHGIVY